MVKRYILHIISIFFILFAINCITATPSFADGESSVGEREDISGQCDLNAMNAMYQGNNDPSMCWYCSVVVIMTNAYLSAVDACMSSVQELATLIAELGFMIWLAHYILLQVSSLSPTSPGKMLQEILVMGFKVALVLAAIKEGSTLIIDYFLNPIMSTGIDYGNEILKALISEYTG